MVSKWYPRWPGAQGSVEFMVRRRRGEPHYALKTRIRGRQTILTIGRHGKGSWGPERARREAIRLLGLIRDGKDPAAERAADKVAPILAEFAQRYMAEYAQRQKKPRSIEEDWRLLRLYVLPALGQLQSARACEPCRGSHDQPRYSFQETRGLASQ